MDKTEVAKVRAKLRLDMLCNFKEVKSVELPKQNEIPLKWSKFPNKENDYWKLLETNDNVDKTSCLYEIDAKGIFETHKHEKQTETITLLTEGSKVEFVTEEGIFFYEYPASFTAIKGVMHALVNQCEHKVLFRVDWTPKMNGWDAEFKQKE